jgi:prepilin-type processing-associated H-X9-DG protein
MPIPFTCPHCGAQTNVDDQYAGRTGPCTGCGQPITVPLRGGSASGKSSGRTVALIVILGVLGCVLVVGGIFVALLLPAVQAVRESTRREQTANNLKQIGIALRNYNGSNKTFPAPSPPGLAAWPSINLKRIALAMHNYHDIHKTFPAAVLTGEDDRPMRSWRVAILPFIESREMFEEYDFNWPWDAPQNGPLKDRPVMLYQSSSEAPPSCETNYLMVVGKGTLGGEPNESVSMAKIPDGTANTIMVIEVGESKIHWMEPRDMTVDEAVAFLTNQPASPFKHLHPNGANVAMADGSVHFIPNTIDPEKLRALLTRDDGQAVDDF